MPNKSETNLGNYFKLPNPGLRSYFEGVRRGQPDVVRAPFANKSNPQKVLDEWSVTLDQLQKEWPTLVDFENDLRAKVGPLSVQLPLKDRIEDIDHYYDDISLPSTPINEQAIKSVTNELRLVRGLRMRSQLKTVDLMKKSTNSGSPYFTKKRTVVDETIPFHLSIAGDKVVQDLISINHTAHRYYACACLGWRGQEGGPSINDVKQRVVWMFPFAVNIAELQVYQPLIEAFQHLNLVPAWVSMESVDRSVTKMFDTKHSDDLVVCTDFSKFDQHFNHSLQNASQQILEYLLSNSGESKTWLREVFPIKYMIPLMYDYGKFRFGPHGMGSGSGGTNCDETLAHRCLQYECALTAGRVLNPHSQCLGDDGILTYPGITVDDVVRSYTAHGLEMNTSKQYASKQDCVYLRRWHHENYRVDGICVGVYSTYRALGRLMFQERFYDPDLWSAKMVALRQLSIIENVKYHPLKDKFADFCIKRDKYRLGLDIPGFLDNIEGIAKESIELIPEFLGYTRSLNAKESNAYGINDWWIVRYLRSIQ